MRLNEWAGMAPRVYAMSEMDGEPRVCARRGSGVRVFEMRCTGRGIEWRGTRSQGGRGKIGISRVFGVCEMEKLGLRV